MNRQIIVTEDGSHSLFIPDMNEQYHSVHGAVQESKHVFIQAGLHQIEKTELTIFEVGFGTGLNAFLTLLENESLKKTIRYFTIEKYPLIPSEFEPLNYPQLLNSGLQPLFLKMHQSNWNESITLNRHFDFYKAEADLLNFNLEGLPKFDLIYFDAFAPNKQSELWSTETYQHLFDHCNPEAVFVTYCAKGVVRRGLQQVGFNIERITGPLGKREMLRGIKP